MTLIVVLWCHRKVLLGSHVSKTTLLLLILAIAFVRTVVSRQPLGRGITHVVTVWRLHTISRRRGMFVLNSLDRFFLRPILVVVFQLASSLAHADVWLLFELVRLIVVVGVIITNLGECCVTGGHTSIELGLVLALTDLGVALDLRLAVLLCIRLSLADLLHGLGRGDLLFNRHRLLRVNILELLARHPHLG